jgi:hypothetical protein
MEGTRTWPLVIHDRESSLGSFAFMLHFLGAVGVEMAPAGLFVLATHDPDACILGRGLASRELLVDTKELRTLVLETMLSPELVVVRILYWLRGTCREVVSTLPFIYYYDR